MDRDRAVHGPVDVADADRGHGGVPAPPLRTPRVPLLARRGQPGRRGEPDTRPGGERGAGPGGHRPGATFTDIADALVDQTYDLFDHTACHYSDIQRAAGTVLSGRGSYGAVVNVVEFTEQLRFGDSPARYSGATTGTFEELSIGVYTDGSPDSDLFIRLDAPANLYHRAELRLIGEELIAYIRAVVAAGAQPVGTLDVVGGAERHQVLTEPNDTRAPLPGLTVPQLFARQAERDPDAVALVSADATVSYRDLDERSSRLAGALRRRHVGPETVVAVALPRSADLAVALLGVAKAGGAYLPLDPAADADLLASRVAGTSARALLTDAATAARLPAGPDVTVLALDDLTADTADGDAAPAAPARYVRTTCWPWCPTARRRRGRRHPPEHGAARPGPPLAAGRPHTVLWHTPHTSDALALELWVPLLGGGRVVVAPAGDLTAGTLTEARATHGITTVWLPARPVLRDRRRAPRGPRRAARGVDRRRPRVHGRAAPGPPGLPRAEHRPRPRPGRVDRVRRGPPPGRRANRYATRARSAAPWTTPPSTSWAPASRRSPSA